MLRSSFKRGKVRFGAATFAAIVVLTMAGAASADADGSLTGFSLSAATVDPQTGAGHLSLRVTCVDPASFIRTRFTASQSSGVGGRDAVSLGVTEVFGCAAGETITLPLAFGAQEGRFHPGPATFNGFVFANAPGGITIGFVTFNETVLLRPR